MNKSHMGKNLAEVLAQCLKDYGLNGCILAVIAHNASNNNTMVKELEGLLDGFLGKLSQGCCFAHILNITCILSVFTKTKGKLTGKLDGDNNDNKDIDDRVHLR
ncbi:hypothetical protein BOTBODRAFT_177285 [Botryobasidium botryosum FD-172 SS1]|uniref:DUF659 domain-containing protein n=1 Tax=Botryobasidium botryosum (strain FD-172 SS1) TaxID=930990 RepID=A0A067MIR2_BOTB1|nr:hypothetical protein BOTBODRAFT_177285 [Botryobasidium botryosum FD-172 SS1]